MKSHPHRTLIAITVAAAVAASPLAAADGSAGEGPAEGPAGGKAASPEQMGHGTLEPVVGQGKMGGPESITNETMEQVAKHWIKLRAKSSRTVPPLREIVPVPEGRAPGSPPSTVAADRTHETFVFHRNTTPSSVVPLGSSSVVNEPSVVARGDHVFYTGNWYTATSTDGGATFSFGNPFSGPFPNPSTSENFCCDQVTAYDPSHDMTLYVQQYVPSATRGVQRLNVDLGTDGTFDCHFDITPPLMGMGANTWPDFPDLAVSDNFVYMSTNVFSTTTFAFVGAFVVRLPLADVAGCTSTPFDVYRELTGFFSFKLTRGATDRMYFADHITNASMRIWRWREVDSAPIAFDRAVGAWTEAPRTCPVPDTSDPCAFVDRRLTGAYVADGEIGFMWTPAQGSGFPLPYTRFAQFFEPTLLLTAEPLVWSGSLAWIYPSVAVNSDGDLGGTVIAAGSIFPSCVVWLADDVNGDTIAPLENQVASSGSAGPSVDRSGDYTSSARYYPNQRLFAGACFSIQTSSAGSASYILFGREGSGPPSAFFTDGFESGDLSAWTASVP